MTEELEQLLHNLRLHTVAERFDAHLAQAEADGLPVAKLFVALLRDEWHARQEQALKRRLQRARLPEIWTIESFPFKQQTGVDRRRHHHNDGGFQLILPAPSAATSTAQSLRAKVAWFSFAPQS
ncbi:MAG: ATP-binding protein [Sedimenticolaceae bacterium]